MNKEKKKGKALLVTIILILALLPAVGILSYTQYFAWDSQIEGNAYKIAFEKDGKLYELSFQGNSLAFDKGTNDDQLYLSSFSYLGDLIAFSYNDYKIEKTENPFFAGSIRSTNSQKYYEQQTKFTNPKDSYQTYTFYDQNRTQIFAYEPAMESEFVSKIRPTFPMFTKNRYTIGAKRDYLNVTKILKAKLNKNLKIRTDEDNKLLILSFQ